MNWINLFFLKKMTPRAGVIVAALLSLLSGGCSSLNDNIDSRKHDKWLQYGSMSWDTRALIEQKIISTGMSADAVFIAFGEPDEKFAEQTVPEGSRWGYGEYMGGKKPKIFFKEFERGGRIYLQKCTKKEKNVYSRVEIIFSRDKVLRWELMGKQN
ncbi:MAG: hypothetical protein ACP5TE_10385 [Verrucomicrobiia bacterium]|jgi:hypothetical protein